MATKKALPHKVEETIAFPRCHNFGMVICALGVIFMMLMLVFIVVSLIWAMVEDRFNPKLRFLDVINMYFLIAFFCAAILRQSGAWLSGFAKDPKGFFFEHHEFPGRFKLILWTIFFSTILLLIRNGIEVMAVDYEEARTALPVFANHLLPSLLPAILCSVGCFVFPEFYRRKMKL